MAKSKDYLLKKLEIMELERKLHELEVLLSDEDKLKEKAITLIASKTKNEMLDLLINANHNNTLGVTNNRIIEVCDSAYEALDKYSNGTMRVDIALENIEDLLEILKQYSK